MCVPQVYFSAKYSSCHRPHRREIFVGRLAMTGFFSAVIGELLTGKGALGQLGLETRLPQPVVNWLVIAIVGFNVVTALNPFGSTFSKENQQDVRKRPTGAVQKPQEERGQRPQGAGKQPLLWQMSVCALPAFLLKLNKYEVYSHTDVLCHGTSTINSRKSITLCY